MELDYVKLNDIKPLLSGYILGSQALMKKYPVPDEEVVHDIRVLMKKSRAVLKLTAPQLDREVYKRDYLAFREVGRTMCPWRETWVHRKTLKDLRKEFPAVFSMIEGNEKLASLSGKNVPGKEPSDGMKEGIELVDDLLNKAGYRLRFQDMTRIDPHLLIRELDKTYTGVSDLYLCCRNNPKPGNLHEFRKKVKDFLYQLYIFRNLNPHVVKSLEKRLDGMARNLGKFNDLTQLVKALDYKCPGQNMAGMDELIIRIREKQDRYLSKVWPSAFKIFCPGQKLVNILGFKLLVI
jgi:CHAD domain-containing protein